MCGGDTHGVDDHEDGEDEADDEVHDDVDDHQGILSAQGTLDRPVHLLHILMRMDAGCQNNGGTS